MRFLFYVINQLFGKLLGVNAHNAPKAFLNSEELQV
jgi:hypothetical protein